MKAESNMFKTDHSKGDNLKTLVNLYSLDETNDITVQP